MENLAEREPSPGQMVLFTLANSKMTSFTVRFSALVAQILGLGKHVSADGDCYKGEY